jgi:hypothetical protein
MTKAKGETKQKRRGRPVGSNNTAKQAEKG